jgi:hypothetical protein
MAGPNSNLPKTQVTGMITILRARRVGQVEGVFRKPTGAPALRTRPRANLPPPALVRIRPGRLFAPTSSRPAPGLLQTHSQNQSCFRPYIWPNMVLKYGVPLMDTPTPQPPVKFSGASPCTANSPAMLPYAPPSRASAFARPRTC